MQGYLQGRPRYTTGPLWTLTSQYLIKKNNNTVTTCTLANKRSKYMPKNLYYHLICLKYHNFYIGITIIPLHIRIKEHLNIRASSFLKYLIKCKNNLSIKIETIVYNVGNLRIKRGFINS